MSRQSTLLGVLAAVLVVALWWMFLYSPGRDDLAAVESEITAAEAEGVALQQRVDELEAVRRVAPEVEAAIANLQAIVPGDPALPAALRQIQAAADDAGVVIQAVTTERPILVDEGGGLYSMPLSFTLTGSYFQVVDMLRRIEDPTITSRGVRFDNVAIAVEEYPALTVAVSGQMFAILDPVPDPEASAAPAGDGPTAADDPPANDEDSEGES